MEKKTTTAQLKSEMRCKMYLDSDFSPILPKQKNDDGGSALALTVTIDIYSLGNTFFTAWASGAKKEKQLDQLMLFL